MSSSVSSADFNSVDLSETPALYLFTRDNRDVDGETSFIFIPADDRFPAVLGYGVSPKVPDTDLPENLKSWLEDYTSQIESLRLSDGFSGSVRDMDVPEEVDYITKYRKPVEPLVRTRWDQLSPYRDMCPVSPSGIPCLTGCVATAMAQVMYYHKWPEMGRGRNSYSWGGGELSFDFENTTFDWDNMLLEYSPIDGNRKERDAIGTLMLACGISVYMNYSPTASGAYSKMVADAMKDYFLYDEGTSNVTRINYTESEWENIIYGELEAGRPVLYTGAGEGGGHAFVCDGYDTDGYYHFNWGWSGVYDGYFRLAALNPRGTGAGGGTGAYNNYQDAIIGICRPGEHSIEPITPIYCTGGFGMENTYTAQGDYYEVIFKFPENGGNGWIVNGSIHEQPGTLGIVFVKDTENVLWCEGPDCVFGSLSTDGSMTGYMRYSVMVPRNELSPGSYMIFPAFRHEGGGWIRPRVMNGQPQYVVMTVNEDGKIRFSTRCDEQAPELEIDIIGATSDDFFGTVNPLENGDDSDVGEIGKSRTLRFYAINRDIIYDGLVGLYLCGGGEDDFRLVKVMDHMQRPFTIEEFSIDVPFDIPDGDYTAQFRNYYGYPISPGFPVTVATPTGVERITGEPDTFSGVVEYYTIEGIRISDPEGYRGILIERSPDGIRKVSGVIL